MNLKNILASGASACLLFTAHHALAHDAIFHGVSQSMGIINGLTHSFTGLDHLLAMVAVGALASKKNAQGQLQTHFWLLPFLFIISMATGAISSQLGINFSPEPLIAGSLVVLGGMLILAKPMPLLLTSITVAGFAFCHGFAHGTAVQTATVSNAVGCQLFILGAVMASALLHTGGFVLAHLLKNFVLRIAGCGVLLTGMVLSL